MKRPLLLAIVALFIYLLPLSSGAQGLTINFTSNGFCNWNLGGDIDITVTGGTPPYTYNWSNGNSTANLTNVSPGTYCLTITDAMGASASDCSTLQGELQATVSTTPETCSNGDGKAWVNIIHGTPPYTYFWSSGPGTDTAVNLHYGNYYLSVTDSAGCMLTGPNGSWSFDTINFTIARNLPYSYTITTTDFHCPNPGSAAVHLTGGTPPITYFWSTTPPQTTDSVGNLLAGSYTVTISDATAGCSIEEHVSIANIAPLTGTTTSTPEVCNFVNGTATIVPTSGTPPYTYSWNTNPIQSSVTATNLASGSVSVTVLDANNCMNAFSAYVGYTSPIQLNMVTTNEICSGSNGSISTSPALGSPPYTFHWSINSTASSINNLSQGCYSVTVNDTQGCTVAASSCIMNVPSFQVNITYTATSCISPTGTATAHVTGSTGPFTYRWGTSPVQTTQTATGLAQGYYLCTVTDTSQCSGVFSVSVPYINIITATTSETPALCLTPSGTATVTPTGGQAPYTYHWSNSQTTQTAVNLASAYYTVTITDSVSCTNVKYVYVSAYSNLNLSINVTRASCIFTNDGQATANVSNYAPPLTYQWSNGQNSQTTTGLTANWCYTVWVSDANGCTAQRSTAYIGYDSLTCAAIVSGKVVKDLDQNCQLSSGDVGLQYISLQAIPGYYDITDPNGDYSFILPPGNYAINQTLPYHTFQLCPPGSLSFFGLAAGSDTANNNFYDTVRTAYDLSVSYAYYFQPRPGFAHSAIVNYGNDGNVTMNATIEYDYDSVITITGASWPYTQDFVNHKLFFNASNLQPGYHSWFDIYFYTPAITPLGTLISECAHITPLANDVNFINNDYCSSIQVEGAFDPNIMTVVPKGIGSEGYISRDDSVLLYTVRFQNTGTLSATNIVVLDTLDSDVDPSSFELVTSSHEVRPDFFQNKYLALYFDNINLPDSNSNELGSHGVVSFRVKQRPNLANGTQIFNSAAIYFDYNLPVITNSVLNTIQVISGITEAPDWKVKVYPNPTSGLLNIEFENTGEGKIDLDMYDLVGKRVLNKSVGVVQGRNTIQLDTQNLIDGLYTLEIKNGEGKFSAKKILIQK